jgi:hypothetical protein
VNSRVELIRKYKEKFRSARSIPPSGKRPLGLCQAIICKIEPDTQVSALAGLLTSNETNCLAYIVVRGSQCFDVVPSMNRQT